MGWANAGGWSGRGWGKAAAGGSAAVTWNPSDIGSSISLDGTKLVATSSGATQPLVRATASHSTGKYYFEFTVGANFSNEINVGWTNAAEPLTTGNLYSDTHSFCYRVGDQIYINSSAGGFQGGGANSTIGLAVDFGAMLAWATLNGSTWTGAGNPASGTGGLSISALTGGPWFPVAVITTATDAVTANFGPTYTYTAPSGFSNV